MKQKWRKKQDRKNDAKRFDRKRVREKEREREREREKASATGFKLVEREKSIDFCLENQFSSFLRFWRQKAFCSAKKMFNKAMNPFLYFK
jgi:hypothetical protein